MNHAVVVCLSVVFLTPLLLAQTKSSTTKRVFRTESGNRAVIRPVDHTGESVVDFFSPGGGKSCSADYSSADGSHGFVMAKAEWSPDQRYFVFSMQSSGGHQPGMHLRVFTARTTTRCAAWMVFSIFPASHPRTLH